MKESTRSPATRYVLMGVGVIVLTVVLALGSGPILRELVPDSPGGSSPSPVPPPPTPKKEGQARPAPHPSLQQSSDPSLRLLGEYEQTLDYGFGRMMVFQDMPHSQAEALQYAEKMATTLAEYKNQEILPFVVFEPEGLDLKRIDWQFLETYFLTLKQKGISDASIGYWAFFPEPNIPEWGQPAGETSPTLFQNNYTQAATYFKKVFPGGKLTLLLNSASYPSGDTEYAQADYSQQTLLTYVDSIQLSLIDEVALQGFPWVPDSFDPEQFLPASSAIALAQKTAVKKVVLNTGTFASMQGYNQTVANRRETLQKILAQALKIKAAGMDVTIHLFAEDKSQAAEATNWSYTSQAGKETLRHFVDDITAANLHFLLYDTPSE